MNKIKKNLEYDYINNLGKLPGWIAYQALSLAYIQKKKRSKLKSAKP